ncbi:MAG: lysophospholipase [Rhodospirillales bacterium]|nr:MAG: lysophospholipase [Rhodospirillales bacterium]
MREPSSGTAGGPAAGNARTAPCVTALICLAAMLAVAGCAPTVTGLGPPAAEPVLAEDHIVTADGTRLPLQIWRPDGPPAAVLIGLHGFGDYANGFDRPARWWAERGILTYAYDQRGFGRTETRGLWPGTTALVSDFGTAARLIRVRHPGLPLYAVGVSMGGSVILAAQGAVDPAPIDGAILSAPGVAGAPDDNRLQRAGLWLATHLMPWSTVSGEHVRRHPSDNIEMLRALHRDPHVMKKARLDVVYGLITLADDALAAAPRSDDRLLVLYGRHEDIVLRGGREALLATLPAGNGWRLAEYPDGYHLLLRDRNAELVYADVVAWLRDADAPLPSGAERRDRTLRPAPSDPPGHNAVSD